jgi:hypothetical protein
MPTPTYSAPQGPQSLDQIQDWIVKLVRDLNYQFGNLDNKNITNVANFLASETELKSKNGLVGLSSAVTGTNDIRIWAGNQLGGVPPFRVYENGTMVATNADITGKVTASSGKIGGWDIDANGLSGAGIVTGGTLRTAASGTRVEMSGNALSTYAASGSRNGPSWGTGAGSGTVTFGDTYWYHEGVELLAIYDNATNYRIRPGAGANEMILGTAGKTTYAEGAWAFSGLSGIMQANGGAAATAIAGLSGTFYVATTSGGPVTTAISFTNGVRTA